MLIILWSLSILDTLLVNHSVLIKGGAPHIRGSFIFLCIIGNRIILWLENFDNVQHSLIPDDDTQMGIETLIGHYQNFPARE